MLTGCPYTEGCEALPATAMPGTDAGPTPEAGPGVTPPEAGVVDSGDSGRSTFVPVGPIAPNCGGFTETCSGNDCCGSTVVPGGTFNRSNDPAYPATVSDFKLDVYEVVVGRFRAFVNSGQGTQANPPVEGAGAHPSIPGSGWSSAWNANLQPDSTALVAALKCNADYQPWSDAPGANETRPMNCVTWYDAAAFCAWDGGFLPTETEWNYASAGGDEQRPYPWGEGLDDQHAVYGCTTTGEPNVRACTFADYHVPGSLSPAGDGRWGHADMAGNVWEWTFDYSSVPYTNPCTDCARTEPSNTPASGRNAPERAFRGGAFNWAAAYQGSSFRASDPPTVRYGSVGFRCARPL